MKIIVISGSRADYNINFWVLEEMSKHNDIKFESVILEGIQNYIIDNGEYRKHKTWTNKYIKIEGDTMPQKAGYCVSEIGSYFADSQADYVMILGDRFEILMVCACAKLFNIPIIHLGGGEVSEGSYDNDFRDCISRLASAHFTISNKCSDRLKAKGITENVYAVGSPRIDYIDKFEYNPLILKYYGLDTSKQTVLVVYHPETNDLKNIEAKAKKFFDSLLDIDLNYIIIYPNHDSGSECIYKLIDNLQGNNIRKFKTLHLEDWLSVMNAVDMMIGNSSAGIMETPTFKLPCVNVGNRQQGRDRSGNVIDCDYDNIRGAIYEAISFKNSMTYGTFGDGKVSERIVNIIRREL
jgi:UDP-hydrolysing UDP-N-acetyl-D-glucosamine 2-epimerase